MDNSSLRSCATNVKLREILVKDEFSIGARVPVSVVFEKLQLEIAGHAEAIAYDRFQRREAQRRTNTRHVNRMGRSNHT